MDLLRRLTQALAVVGEKKEEAGLIAHPSPTIPLPFETIGHAKDCKNDSKSGTASDGTTQDLGNASSSHRTFNQIAIYYQQDSDAKFKAEEDRMQASWITPVSYLVPEFALCEFAVFRPTTIKIG